MAVIFAIGLALLGRPCTVQRGELHGSGGGSSSRTCRTALPTTGGRNDLDTRATKLADADTDAGWIVDAEAAPAGGLHARDADRLREIIALELEV